MGVHFEGDGPVPLISSEFAEVWVSVDNSAHSPRLRLEDMRTGRVRFLDAMELEAVIWLREDRLTALMDPSADRWRGES